MKAFEHKVQTRGQEPRAKSQEPRAKIRTSSENGSYLIKPQPSIDTGVPSGSKLLLNPTHQSELTFIPSLNSHPPHVFKVALTCFEIRDIKVI